MKQQTVNGVFLVVLAAAFFSNAWMDMQRHEHTFQKIHELNQTDVFISDELAHQRERRQRLAGRVLFLESDLEDLLGPNWTHVDQSDNISVTECWRVNRTEIECSISADFTNDSKTTTGENHG